MQTGVVETILGILTVVLSACCVGLLIRLRRLKARCAADRRAHEEKLATAQVHLDDIKTVEQALRESEGQFRQIVETSPMGIHLFQLEPDGRLVLIGANPAANRILGRDHSRLIGLTIEEAFPSLTHTELPRRYRQVASEGRPWSSEHADFQDGRITGAYEVYAFQTKPQSLAVVFLDITQRKQTELALRESEVRLHRLASAIEQAAEDIMITDVKGNIEYVNPAFERITGYTWAEVVGQNSRLLKSGRQPPRFYQELWSTIASGKTWTGRFVNRCKNGTLVEEDATISPIFAPQGGILGFVSVKRDITEQVKMEQHLRQAQKMEAIGQLAGGVAHDFNNLLQAIKGFTDLALEELETGHAAREFLGEVIKASNRATVLVRQLLAFSRRESIRPQRLQLNDLLGCLVKMISRVIGEHIELTLIPRHNLKTICADPGQMEQILMNLCVNARDAMPHGGRITIETANVSFDDTESATKPWARPGPFVGLFVTDTGIGMSPEVLEHLFEPFFTTKEVGKGTGLGLATIYGIVKQHEGLIHVESEPQRGSVFRIYLPAIEEPTETKTDSHSPVPALKSQGETILLAEDEAVVRELALRILEKAGYHVLVAHDGHQAIDLFHQHADRIDLALLDVVMPHKSGRAVCEEIRALKPNLAVLFSSGYGRAHLGADFEPQEGTELIHKPFEPNELLAKVREVMKR
jgi:PAS domain S-box-containing protein